MHACVSYTCTTLPPMLTQIQEAKRSIKHWKIQVNRTKPGSMGGGTIYIYIYIFVYIYIYLYICICACGCFVRVPFLVVLQGIPQENHHFEGLQQKSYTHGSFPNHRLLHKSAVPFCVPVLVDEESVQRMGCWENQGFAHSA